MMTASATDIRTSAFFIRDPFLFLEAFVIVTFYGMSSLRFMSIASMLHGPAPAAEK